MPHDVFISYSSKDKTSADAACAVLEGKGIRCWIAPRDIRPGDDWGEAIVNGINGAQAFLLVFSRHANASAQVKREVERAVNAGLPVIPMRIEAVLPAKSLEYFLSTPHWLDAFTPPLAAHLDYLAGVVRSILDGDTSTARLPGQARSGVSRRALLATGAAGLAAAIGAAAIALWPKQQVVEAPSQRPVELPPPVPDPPPTFEGKWVLEKLDFAEEGWANFYASNIASINDPFSRSGVTGGTTAMSFEVNDMSQYKFDIEIEDRGAITRAEKIATVTSDLDGRASRSKFYVLTPDKAGRIVDMLGGKPGDHVVVFEQMGPYGQIDFCGTPVPGAVGVTADIAGHWITTSPPSPAGPLVRSIDFTRDGRYQYHVIVRDRGNWLAADGKWTRQRQNGSNVNGTYRFDGPGRVTLASGAETMIFRRA